MTWKQLHPGDRLLTNYGVETFIGFHLDGTLQIEPDNPKVLLKPLGEVKLLKVVRFGQIIYIRKKDV
ncbi:MAG: hypothetical protein ABID54_13325 [Pseudomonadota bacterium]